MAQEDGQEDGTLESAISKLAQAGLTIPEIEALINNTDTRVLGETIFVSHLNNELLPNLRKAMVEASRLYTPKEDRSSIYDVVCRIFNVQIKGLVKYFSDEVIRKLNFSQDILHFFLGYAEEHGFTLHQMESIIEASGNGYFHKTSSYACENGLRLLVREMLDANADNSIYDGKTIMQLDQMHKNLLTGFANQGRNTSLHFLTKKDNNGESILTEVAASNTAPKILSEFLSILFTLRGLDSFPTWEKCASFSHLEHTICIPKISEEEIRYCLEEATEIAKANNNTKFLESFGIQAPGEAQQMMDSIDHPQADESDHVDTTTLGDSDSDVN